MASLPSPERGLSACRSAGPFIHIHTHNHSPTLTDLLRSEYSRPAQPVYEHREHGTHDNDGPPPIAIVVVAIARSDRERELSGG